jgi:RNA polymerase sigma-70 factor (ECF subfamily)
MLGLRAGRPYTGAMEQPARSSSGAAPGIDVARFYTAQFRRVFSFALRILGDESEAADMAQETFLAIAKNPGAFRGESKPLTWALAITKRLCTRRLRGRRQRSFSDIAALIDAESRPLAPIHSEVERRLYVAEVKAGCLAGLLCCLPLSQRCVFVLHLLSGLSIAEVGKVMGKNANSIRILLSRARGAIRAFLCANCSLMAPHAKCSCENMIEFSLKRGLIERLEAKPGLREIAVELRRFADEVELYRSLPEPEAAIARALRSGRYPRLQEKAK